MPEAPFFIVGAARSGTTALQQALNRHPEVTIPPETFFFLRLWGHPFWKQKRTLAQITSDFDIEPPHLDKPVRNAAEAAALFLELMQRYAQRRGKDATRIGEKTPRHLFAYRDIRRVFPSAKFILIVRDGRDVALSRCQVPWASSDLFLNFGEWLASARMGHKLVSELGGDVHTLRYEDLVLQPSIELRKITEFLGIEYKSTMAEGGGSTADIPTAEMAWKSRSVEKLQSTRVGVWRHEMSRETLEYLESWGMDELLAGGYDLSTAGKKRLPAWFSGRLWLSRQIWRTTILLNAGRRWLR